MFEPVNSNWHGIPLLSCLQTSCDFVTTCKKIPRYSGEPMRQMAPVLIAQHYFHGILVHRVVKLSFRNKFFSDQGFYMSQWTWHTCSADAKANISMLHGNYLYSLTLIKLKTAPFTMAHTHVACTQVYPPWGEKKLVTWHMNEN